MTGDRAGPFGPPLRLALLFVFPVLALARGSVGPGGLGRGRAQLAPRAADTGRPAVPEPREVRATSSTGRDAPTLFPLAGLSRDWSPTAPLLMAAGGQGRPDAPEPPYSISSDLPLRFEDAEPTGYRRLQVQFATIYDRTHDGRDRYRFEPQLKYGVAPQVDVHVLSPLLGGNDGRTGSGDLQVNGQWEFLLERPGSPWPALAVQGQLELPTGRDAAGVDPSVKFIATKTISAAYGHDELHVNVNYAYDAGPAGGDRRSTLFALLGYSRRLTDRTVLVADYVWEQRSRRDEDWHRLEAGLVYELSEHLRVAAGVGTGLGGDAPSVSGTVGVNYRL